MTACVLDVVNIFRQILKALLKQFVLELFIIFTEPESVDFFTSENIVNIYSYSSFLLLDYLISNILYKK